MLDDQSQLKCILIFFLLHPASSVPLFLFTYQGRNKDLAKEGAKGLNIENGVPARLFRLLTVSFSP